MRLTVSTLKLFTAAVVAPMNRPPFGGGGVLVGRGRILAVGDAAEIRREHPAAELVDLGDVLLAPGLVNAHTHLELSTIQRPPPGQPFVDWILGLIGAWRDLGPAIHGAAAEGARRGAEESIRFGVTCVGDITRFPSASRPILSQSPLRAVSFGEIQAMAGRRYLLPNRLTEATDMAWDGWTGASRLLTAISPHAPYSVEPEAFRACRAWADEHRRPITTHLAETPAEAEFLAEHSGEFRRLWAALGDWRDDVPRFTGGPIRLAEELGLLGRALLAHVNYVDEDELALLASRKAAVVWCPRTHAYFGHPPHRFREMLERGMTVCLGTDSRVSAPDLDVMAEARQVHREHPDLPAEAIWRMITSAPAAGLGLGGEIGELVPGSFADFSAWRREGSDAVLSVLESASGPESVWIGGEPAQP